MMVRRSSMVYELLKSERRDDGFTPKEIIDRVSRTYEITAGKGLRKQVTVALRRGIDFGIIARKNNKYRFDPGSTSSIEEWAPRKGHAIVNDTSAKTSTAKKRRRTGHKKKKPSTSAKSRANRNGMRQQRRTRLSTRRSELPPRPRVPKPPNWNPKRRNLSEEPITKVIKHTSSQDDSS